MDASRGDDANGGTVEKHPRYSPPEVKWIDGKKVREINDRATESI